MSDVCVIGGGPGGFMTAWYLQQKSSTGALEITIFEADQRIGGKVRTGSFGSSDPSYELGVAEIYDYPAFSRDPLRSLIEDTLGLSTVDFDSSAIALNGEFLDGVDGLRRQHGNASADAVLAFYERCKSMLSLDQYYEGVGAHDNGHPWAQITFAALLDREVTDPIARRFLEVASRSDIASEPHLTNGLNGIKNVLMDVDDYIGLYAVVGGNEQIVQRLAGSVAADIQLDHRVVAVRRRADGRYDVDVAHGPGSKRRTFDAVVVALPHNWLSSIRWGGKTLGRAMAAHVAHFDRPGHYLRIVCLFTDPFWRGHTTGNWFMSDAFGGCCVYDEGTRFDLQGRGVLNWLVAGSDVLSYGNLSHEALVREALRTLPKVIRQEAAGKLLDSRVHPWLASVNALPGGMPVRESAVNHLPDPNGHPELFLVGDYLYDSTLNGLLDSADDATDLFFKRFPKTRRRKRDDVAKPAAASLATS